MLGAGGEVGFRSAETVAAVDTGNAFGTVPVCGVGGHKCEVTVAFAGIVDFSFDTPYVGVLVFHHLNLLAGSPVNTVDIAHQIYFFGSGERR